MSRAGALGTEQAKTAVACFLAAAVPASALAMGGALPRWFAPIGFASIVAALVIGMLEPRRRAGPAWPALVMALLAAYCSVQAVPLPLTWLNRLSPAAADIWQRSLLPVGGQVTTGSLSIDPIASGVEALKWSSYAAVFFIAAWVARSRGSQFGLAVVFSSAVLIALVSLGHNVFGAKLVYGFYAPLSTYPSGIGPFLNPNNLAGYLTLGALVGVGLIASRTPFTSRWLIGVGLVIIFAVTLRTGSRGGLLSLGAGLTAFGIWAAVNHRAAAASFKVRASVLAGLLALAVAFTVVSADSRFWSSLLDENADKLKIPLWTVPLIKDYPWFGVGRGGFESVFFQYRPQAANTAFTHPENFLAQWATEWGLPVAIAGLCALAWALLPIRRGATRSALVMGAICGLSSLFLHNLADLGLELAGVGIAVATVLGSIWGSVRTSNGDRRKPAVATAWTLRILLCCGLVSGALAFWSGAAGVDADRAAVRQAIARAEGARNAQTRKELSALIVQMMRKHPADYYFPLAGAFSARLSGENPMPWIQRALERAPTVGRTHVLLGQVLAERGLINQGLMELRLGVIYEPALAIPAARLAVAHSTDAETLLRAAPDGVAGAAMLDAIAASLPSDSIARDRIDAEALSRDETLIEARRRRIDSRLTSLEHGSDLCIAEADCVAFIELQLAELARVAPSHTLAARAKARLLRHEGRPEEAAEALVAGCNAPIERSECLRLRVEILGDLRLRDELEAAVQAYVAASCVERKQCAAANDWVGGFRLGRGDLAQAVSALERAARDEPSAARLSRLADAAERAGLNTTAIDALRRLLAISGSDPGVEARIAALQRTQR